MLKTTGLVSAELTARIIPLDLSWTACVLFQPLAERLARHNGAVPERSWFTVMRGVQSADEVPSWIPEGSVGALREVDGDDDLVVWIDGRILSIFLPDAVQFEFADAEGKFWTLKNPHETR